MNYIQQGNSGGEVQSADGADEAANDSADTPVATNINDNYTKVPSASGAINMKNVEYQTRNCSYPFPNHQANCTEYENQ